MTTDILRRAKESEELVAVGIAAAIAGYIGYRVGKKFGPPMTSCTWEGFPVGLFVGGMVLGGAGLLVGNYYGEHGGWGS